MSNGNLTIFNVVRVAELELERRRRTYPSLVVAGKMDQKRADEDIAGMEQVVEALKTARSERSYQIERAAAPFAAAARNIGPIFTVLSQFTPTETDAWYMAAYYAARRVSPSQWQTMIDLFPEAEAPK